MIELFTFRVSKAADESELERINIESTESTPRIKTK